MPRRELSQNPTNVTFLLLSPDILLSAMTALVSLQPDLFEEKHIDGDCRFSPTGLRLIATSGLLLLLTQVTSFSRTS